MPTPEEVDAAGIFGPFDYAYGTATISRWQSDTYKGRSIPTARWYHVLSTDGITSYGLIQIESTESYAFEPTAVGRNVAGIVVRDLNDGIHKLTPRVQP